MRILVLLAILAVAPCAAQNVVVDGDAGATAEEIRIDAAAAAAFIAEAPDFGRKPQDAEAARVAAKLDAHVRQMLDGWPYRPFFHNLGISGYETYFGHPDELFYSLSLALPYLPRATAGRVRTFLAARLKDAPPYALAGFDPRAGTPRESYTVPDDLRASKPAAAASALGVYAFWLYCRTAGDAAAAKAHWPAVRARMTPLLQSDYAFDIHKAYENDEAERLNGDLAGMLGLARLARLNGDAETEKSAAARLAQLLALRVNLERANPRVLEKTNSTSKHLHAMKLARYCSLVPEVGLAAAELSGGLGAARLRAFREARNAWYLAYGDRFIGGENYTSPPHFSRALFDGAAFVEGIDVLPFVDVPWCKGDLYFIEKCAVALWQASGGKMEPK